MRISASLRTTQEPAVSDDPSNLEFKPRPTGSVMGFPAHGGRSGALGEVHSRPHPLFGKPRVLVQLSFMTEGGSGVDHAVLSALSRRLGIAAPDRQAVHRNDRVVGPRFPADQFVALLHPQYAFHLG